jgi:hypothetical protein
MGRLKGATVKDDSIWREYWCSCAKTTFRAQWRCLCAQRRLRLGLESSTARYWTRRGFSFKTYCGIVWWTLYGGYGWARPSVVMVLCPLRSRGDGVEHIPPLLEREGIWRTTMWAFSGPFCESSTSDVWWWGSLPLVGSCYCCSVVYSCAHG